MNLKIFIFYLIIKMSDIINQIQNIKLELKTLEMQFDNISM